MFHDSLFPAETLLLEMPRKKWTPQTEVTDSLLKFREKRKWQLSYRRYVLEKMPCESYARYFGLNIETLRQWFELQFTEELNWENFGKAWQFYHIVPTHHFDFSNEEDLVLCWNFINIGIERINVDGHETKINPLSTKQYFTILFEQTGFSLCTKIVHKIEQLENATQSQESSISSFITHNKPGLENMLSFSLDEFNRLNQGMTVEDILLEREIFKKFG